MADTYTHLLYHVVFSTKDRAPLMTVAVRDHLYPYIGAIVRNLGGTLIEVGGVADHIHLLIHLKPSIALSNAIRTIKANSSKMVNEEELTNGTFRWQVGYGAFTVSTSGIDQVRRYIRRQPQHHQQHSFRAERVALLEAHGVGHSERGLPDG